MVDWSLHPIGPGFSVIQRKVSNSLSPDIVYLAGFKKMPTVEDILDITNPLLDGRSIATPTWTPIPVMTPTAEPVTAWKVFRDDALGVQVEFPSKWQVDAEDSWVLFYDPPTGQGFNVLTAFWIKHLPNDFTDHAAGTVAMTQTLTVDNRPAVLAQFEPGSALGEVKSQVGVIAPDGRGMVIGNKTTPEIFQHALNSIRFFKPVNSP